MIRINLLPQEYRHGRRISLKVLGAAIGGVLLVCAALGWFAVVYFGELGELRDRHREIAQELEQKQKRAAYYDSLETNRKDYLSRVQTIQDIARSRRLWSQFLDELIDVVNNDGDTERHLAWFDGMTVGGDLKRGLTVTMPGAVQGSEMTRVANLHEDLESSPFWPDMQSKSDPGGRRETDKTKEPAESFGFVLQLQFHPPSIDGKGK